DKCKSVDGSNQDDIFHTGNKLADNPNDWTWSLGNEPGKDDIHNALAFVTQASDGHIWCMVAGDRSSTNGTSYLDVEFYQQPVTKTGTFTGGGFLSLGTANGRSVGDIDMTLSYVGGGNVASISFLRFHETADGSGIFQYDSITPPAGSAFVAANLG